MTASAPRLEYDCVIIGGGLAGLTAAALLGGAGFRCACIDAEPLARQMSLEFDGRTTAISFGSRAVLDQAGVWEGLTRASQAITRIDIRDGDDPFTLTFSAHEMAAEAFGWIVDNADLRRALIQRVQSLETVTHITGLTVQDFESSDRGAAVTVSDGRTLYARLVVGADGRKSFTREKVKIGRWGRDYNHKAVVCLMAHTTPHKGLALEHFRPEGPFALLPFTDLPDGTHRSALVWTMDYAAADYWLKADAGVFAHAVQQRAGTAYGRFTVLGRREAWPLNLVQAYSYAAPRCVLVAEAAHGMHPIAGQGLNMSLRDLEALRDILSAARAAGTDLGDTSVALSYQRARRPDNHAMCWATDSLTLLFSNNLPFVTMMRRVGLRAVARLPWVKRFFMRQAMGQPKASIKHQEVKKGWGIGA